MAVRRVRKKRAYHHGDLRQALVDAAGALVRKEGPEGVSLREVARRVGVTQAAPYHHFESKEALLAAVAEEGFRALTASMREARARPGTAVHKLVAMGRAYVQFAVDNPSQLQLMFGGGVCVPDHPSLHAAAEEAFSVLLEAMTAAMEGRRVAHEPHELALAVWSGVHGLASLWIGGPLQAKPGSGLPIDQLAELVSKVLVRGAIGD